MQMEFITIPVSFDKGINTKVDPKQIMPGEMLSLKNANFITPKELTESSGYTALNKNIYNTGSSITAGNSLGKFADLITLNDGQNIYSYSETIQKWINKGVKVATSISAQTIDTGAAQLFTAGVESVISGINVVKMANGFECYYYLYNINIDGNNNPPVILVIFDPVIGEVVYSNISQNYSQFAVGFSGIFTFVGLSAFHTIDVTSPSTTTTGAIGPFNTIFAITQTATNYYVFALDASTNLVINEYTPSSTLVTSQTVAASSSATLGATINDTFNSQLVLTWSDGTTANYAIYDYTLTQTTAPTSVTFSPSPGSINALTGGTYSSTELSLYFQVGIIYMIGVSSFTSTNQAVVQFNLTSGVLTQGQTWFNVSLASNALPDGNGNQYIAFGHFTTSDVVQPLMDTDQPNYFMMRISPSLYTIVGKYAEDQAASFPLTNLSNLIQLSGTQFLFPYVQSNGEGIILPNVGTSVVYAEINVYNSVRGLLTIGTKLNSVYLGNNENLIGGESSIYDNVGIAEAGFNLFPEIVDRNGGTASGTVFLVPATYSYQILYQWFDAQGNKHRSSPSDIIECPNSNAHGSNLLIVAGLSMSEIYKVNNIQVLLYRNAPSVNINTYFLVARMPNNPTGLVTFADIIPDADIVGAEQLYTTGGEVPNYAPPSFSSTVAYKNRIIGVQADNRFIWWFSKQQIEFFPVEFSDLFTQVIDGSKGQINAVNMMDDKLIFFCENGIFYVLGDGPSPNGTNNDFTYPQIITADTSCNNPNSMVILPIGLMFSSPKGIFLLDRSLQVSYIGALVRNFNTRDIVSATLLPRTTRVVFGFSGGSALMYDYLVQQWSELAEITAVDTTFYNGNFVYLQADGTFLEENLGNYSNNGSPVEMSFQTGWFSFANLQGFQRIKHFLLLLTAQNSTTLKIDCAYNYDPTVQDSRIIPVAASSVPLQYRIFNTTMKFQSMQITVTEIATSSTGGGLTLSGFMFYAGIKKGPYKVTAAQSFG